MHKLNYGHTATAENLHEMRRLTERAWVRHTEELAKLTRRRAELVQFNASSPEAALVRQNDPNPEATLAAPLIALDFALGVERGLLQAEQETIAEIDRRLAAIEQEAAAAIEPPAA
jgi:hypothetical protein